MLNPPLKAAAPPNAEAAPSDAAVAVLDAAALASLRELDPHGHNRLVERVFEAFKTSAARLQPQLRQAGASGDLAGVRHVVHTLKSSSASVGGGALSRLCADLETRIHENRIDDLGARVKVVHDETDKLLRALAAWSAGS